MYLNSYIHTLLLSAHGNVTPQAEFNFYMDPESVHIVFNSNTKPLWLLPWETCLKSRISHVNITKS